MSAAGAALVAALSLSACGGPPDPAPTAEALAAALASGDFRSVPMVGIDSEVAAATRSAAFAPLAGWDLSVSVESVSLDPGSDGGAATATLLLAWRPPGRDEGWTYEAASPLRRQDGTWHAAGLPAPLVPRPGAGERLEVVRSPASRGEILGDSGTAIVTARPVFRIGIDKQALAPERHEAAARALAGALDLEDEDGFAARVAAAGALQFVEAIVVRATDPAYDVPRLDAMEGVLSIPTEMPLAPTRAFARPLLGIVGEATAEIVDASEGLVAAGDQAGLWGLQMQYDAQLRGLPAFAVVVRGPDGAVARTLFELPAVPGAPLRTTLDPSLQEAADTILSDVPPPSGIVAIRPSDGAVLAMASGPGGDGYATAALGTYAPGSTFKVCTALALLRSGLAPDSIVDCPGQAPVEGFAFGNYPGYPASALGAVPLETAFAHSCNTAFVLGRSRVPLPALAAAARALGFGRDLDLGFPAFLGSVPAEAEGTKHAAALIGQGEVAASPLAMAVVAASVARGETVTPRLLADATRTENALAPAAALTPAEAEDLRRLMRATVTQGTNRFLLDLPAPPVLAKSGTAEFGVGQDANHAWMIAIHGDLAVAVFVEHGEYGTTTAGPLLQEFLEAAARPAAPGSAAPGREP